MKCDEAPGKCGNCTRLRLVCSGYASSVRQQTQESMEGRLENSKKKRTYRSCIGCRGSKTKCSGDRPECQRCQTKSITCIYSESCQPNWIQRVDTSTDKAQVDFASPAVVSNGRQGNSASIPRGESCPASRPSSPSLESQKSPPAW